VLAIRMQRTGRSGHAQFRVVVQDSRFSPTRGRVVSYLGSYNPHTKAASLDSEKAAQYLASGAQPSDRVARLFKKEGIKLPKWVKLDEPKKRIVRNPQKRRSTTPVQPKETVADTPAVTNEEPEAETTEPAPEAPAQTAEEPIVEAQETPTEPAAEDPAAPTEKPADSPNES
jgi:small subunit ribosomal protein S16